MDEERDGDKESEDENKDGTADGKNDNEEDLERDGDKEAEDENKDGNNDNEEDDDKKDAEADQYVEDYGEKDLEEESDGDKESEDDSDETKILNIANQLSNENISGIETEDLLRKLVEITPFERVTVPILSETGIGKIVRRLRDEDGTIGRLAGRLVARWKRLIFRYEGPLLPTDTATVPIIEITSPPSPSPSEMSSVPTIEITPPPSPSEMSSFVSQDLEPATRVALIKLRLALEASKKRKAETKRRSSSRLGFNFSGIPNSTPDISSPQLTLKILVLKSPSQKTTIPLPSVKIFPKI